MIDEHPSPHAEPAPASERTSASLLVRCWLEPRETPGAPPILRGYVKNLKTGEEMFIKDLDAVPQQIQRALAPAATADSENSLAPRTARAHGR
jgi:hypothetical protein